MDLFESALNGLQVAASPENLLYCLIGALVGMLVGVLPGLGPVATIAILLPITYNMDPVAAIIMLSGIFYGAQYGGTITSVLLNLPGEATTVVTTFDGYQMARQGRAGEALGIAAIGSFIGGTVSVLGMTVLAPMLASVAIDFGPPEYAALTLLGILLLSTIGTGSTTKALVGAAIGLLLATVGRDPFTGVTRFTFGVGDLADGLGFVPIAMGLFGLGEILHGLDERAAPGATTPRVGRAWPAMSDWTRSRAAVARGTVVGFLLGVLPGGGATLASMLSYSLEKRVSKHREEFGHGAIEGVAGPETANNAAATSSFIPLLTLGIPANGTMAVILGALLLQGVQVGPTLVDEHPDIFWGVISSMWVGNIFLLLLSVPLVGLFVRMLRVPGTLLAAVTVVVTMLGVYTIRNNIFDVYAAIFFGCLGYLMKKVGFDAAPLVLAFVLGSLLETSVRQSLRIFDGSLVGFVQRPISGGILLLIVLLAASSPLLELFRRKVAQSTREASEAGEVDEVAHR